jgi:hypothetical protein
MAKRLPLFTDSEDATLDVLANVQVGNSCELVGLAVGFVAEPAGQSRRLRDGR